MRRASYPPRPFSGQLKLAVLFAAVLLTYTTVHSSSISHSGSNNFSKTTRTEVPAADAPLRVYAQQLGFYIGAAVNMSPFTNEPQYTDKIKREFNVIVAENAFKFDATHPAQNTYNFINTDALVNFAEANGMKIRGHALVWHNQLPSWVTSCNCTRDQAIQIMHDHIRTLVGRYRGRVWAWDVVNEAVDDSGPLRTNSFWYQKIGPDYIDMAFQFAHEADPDALLYYNDYSAEGSGTKSDAVYNLMSSLKTNGVPIDGVGWQCHFVNGFRINQANHTNAQRLAAIGLKISITELDVRIQSPTTTDTLNQQALAYRDLIDFAMSEPNVQALVMWGFTDKYSWIPGFFAGYGDALIFDPNYQPKPSYNALLDGFKSVPLQPVQLQFDSPNYLVSEGGRRVNTTVRRTGDTTSSASVDYVTSDSAGAQNCNVFNGLASSRCDYITSIGTVQFAPGETSKSFSILIVDDSYAESSESFTISLSNPVGASPGPQSTATVTITDNESVTGSNPTDVANPFVRQHYDDFLNREPDASGLAFWTNEITSCGSDQACIELKRINVSAAFYLSIEFQETGYLVERIYKAAYGDGNGTSTFGGAHQLTVPVIRLNEFLPDTQEIGQGVVVGQGNWQQQLEDNKNAFTTEFAQRSRFTTAFPTSMTQAQFVDKLNQNAGNPLSQSERDQLVGDLTSTAKTRAQVLRAVAEDPDLSSSEFNRAFVLMQYFGYLRRNPNDPQDTDYAGYDFWLTKLNQFNGIFVNAEMVKAFIVSGEYRQRFGP